MLTIATIYRWVGEQGDKDKPVNGKSITCSYTMYQITGRSFPGERKLHMWSRCPFRLGFTWSYTTTILYILGKIFPYLPDTILCMLWLAKHHMNMCMWYELHVHVGGLHIHIHVHPKLFPTLPPPPAPICISTYLHITRSQEIIFTVSRLTAKIAKIGP